MNVIIKSGKKNWSGKEFSNLPGKVYLDFEAAVDALNSYHFFIFDNEKCEYIPCDKNNRIEFIFLNSNKRNKLLSLKKVRL